MCDRWAVVFCDAGCGGDLGWLGGRVELVQGAGGGSRGGGLRGSRPSCAKCGGWGVVRGVGVGDWRLWVDGRVGGGGGVGQAWR